MKVTAFAAACLATAVASAPTATKRGTAKGYSVAQNEVALPGQKIGALAYHRSLTKFGGEISDALQEIQQYFTTQRVPVDAKTDAAGGGSGTTVSPGTINDMEYLTPVIVGDAVLNLDIDTGSSDLWVFSDELSPALTNGHDIYQTKKSGFTGTLVPNASWQIQYGDQSTANGDVYTDHVTVAGITAPKQAVEAARSVSRSLAADTASDGIFGFGFSNINSVKPQQQLTWFDNVKGGLEKPLFAAALKHNAPGFYDFGYLNSSRYTGDIVYSPVNTAEGFWEMTVDGYAVGPQNFPGGGPVIADTGTSLVMAPATVVNNYYANSPSAVLDQSVGGVRVLCSERLPDFSLVINGQTRTAPGALFQYAPIDQGSEWCYGGIQDNGGLPFVVLGDTFLKSQYVVFDAGVPQLGFGQATA